MNLFSDPSTTYGGQQKLVVAAVKLPAYGVWVNACGQCAESVRLNALRRRNLSIPDMCLNELHATTVRSSDCWHQLLETLYQIKRV